MYCFWILSNKLDLNPETSFYYRGVRKEGTDGENDRDKEREGEEGDRENIKKLMSNFEPVGLRYPVMSRLVKFLFCILQADESPTENVF